MGKEKYKKKMIPTTLPSMVPAMPVPGKPGGLPIPLKHDFPPYLQMLFSARGRLPYVRPMPKKHNRSMDSVINTVSTIHEKFIEQPPPPPKTKV